MTRKLLVVCLVMLAFVGCAPEDVGSPIAQPDYEEHDIATLQQSMEEGEVTAEELVDYYLGRIEAVDR